MNAKKGAKLRGVIAKYAVIGGAETRKEQAARALIDIQCYNRRWDNPGNFTLDELEKIAAAFRMPWSEIAEALS